MIVPPGVQQDEPSSQLFGKTCRIVSIDGQPTAFFRAVECKRSNYDMTAGLDDLFHARDVSRAVRRISQKVKGRPIMPNVEGLRRAPFGHVGDDPMYLTCSFTEPRLGRSEPGLRNVQYRHAVEPARDEAINKT